MFVTKRDIEKLRVEFHCIGLEKKLEENSFQQNLWYELDRLRQQIVQLEARLQKVEHQI